MAFKESSRMTAEEVKKKIGPRCHDILAKAVLAASQKDMDRKVEEVRKALDEMLKYSGKSAPAVLNGLKRDVVASLFVENPKVFVDMAKSSGSNFDGVINKSFALNEGELKELFLRNPVNFARVVKVTGGSVNALFLLSDEDVSKLYIRDPEKVISSFSEISKAAGKNANSAFLHLVYIKTSTQFAKDPKPFVDIAKISGEKTMFAFTALNVDEIVDLLAKKPDLVVSAFSEISKSAGRHVGSVFASFVTMRSNPVYGEKPDKGTINIFTEYCDGRISKENMLFSIYSQDRFAIEVGRYMDEFHNDDRKRKEFLSGLDNMQVLGLLSSNPEYFFTSSNHLLFDRLKNDLKNEGKTVSQIFEEKGLAGSEIYRNLIFRSINYDRFYGKANSIFGQNEIKGAMEVFTAPIGAEVFDDKYFFILVNGLDTVKGSKVTRDFLQSKLEARLGELQGKVSKSKDERMIESALEFMAVRLDPKTVLVPDEKKERIAKLEEKSIFNKDNYSEGKKLVIVQVFDKEDTEKDHWIYTQEWFNKGKKAKEGPGRIDIETKDAKIILFMGNDSDENQKFVKQQLKETPNLAITFRGHSYSLEENFPYDTFKDKDSHVLFIPGSCGSSGSISEYIKANKDTDMKFFSNTSTGKGQVTNAIIDVLMKAKTTKKFDELLKENSKYLEQNGGDVGTIKVFGPGEMLLRYIYGTDAKL